MELLGGKTQQMHGPGKSESPPGWQGLPRLAGELSRLGFRLRHAPGWGGGAAPAPPETAAAAAPARILPEPCSQL